MPCRAYFLGAGEDAGLLAGLGDVLGLGLAFGGGDLAAFGGGLAALGGEDVAGLGVGVVDGGRPCGAAEEVGMLRAGGEAGESMRSHVTVAQPGPGEAPCSTGT